MPGQGSVKTRPGRLKMAAKLSMAKDDIAKLTHRETITRDRDVDDPVGVRALPSPSPKQGSLLRVHCVAHFEGNLRGSCPLLTPF
jgi:hypothetical protein